jgi:hypothetical protein
MERVMRWRLILEEYMPEFIYLKGEHNFVTDTLCQVELDMPKFNTCYYARCALSSRSLCCNDLPADAFPSQYELIVFHQTKNNLSYLINSSQPMMAIISYPFVEAARSET